MKSDQQRPADATENWLRQTLGSHRPEAPADAWQRLAPYLPQPKRRNPVAFYLSGAAVVAAAVAALFWFWKSAATTLASPVAIEKVQPVARIAPAVLPKTLEEKTPAISSEKIAQSTAEPFSKNHFSEKTSLQDATGLPNNLAAATPVEADFFEKEKISPAGLSQKNTPQPAKYPLEKLPGKALAQLVLPENPLPEFQFSPLLVLQKKANAPRFWLGIEAAPAIFLQKNMGEMPVGLAFPEAHLRPGRGCQVGVSLVTEPLKNWRVALGIRHLQYTHEAAHSATLRLMDGVCLNPDYLGLKEYEFRYAVVSGGEQNHLTLRLQQQDIGSTMPADEPFTLDMKTVHSSTAWRVPLSVERQFRTGSWRIFVNGGAVVDFSRKTKMEVTHFTEACEDLCFQGGHFPVIQASGRAGARIGWQAGAGIEPRVSSRASLRFELFTVGMKSSKQYGLSIGLLFSN